jgi:hypothetical protein
VRRCQRRGRGGLARVHRVSRGGRRAAGSRVLLTELRRVRVRRVTNRPLKGSWPGEFAGP